MSSTGERPARRPSTRARLGVDADHLPAGLDEIDGERQPDVAEAEDRDRLVRGHGDSSSSDRSWPGGPAEDSPSAARPSMMAT